MGKIKILISQENYELLQTIFSCFDSPGEFLTFIIFNDILKKGLDCFIREMVSSL